MANLTLYLQEPPLRSAAEEHVLTQRRQTLQDEFEKLLRDEIRRTIRGELKLWIVQTVKKFEVSPDVSFAKFKNPLHSSNEQYLKSVLMALCKIRPQVVGPILQTKTQAFKSFFRNHPQRVKQWFDHFLYTGKTDLGATALEHYAFVHRDWFWTKNMIWRSPRPISPIIAAQQRQLLMHLDVEATINGLLTRNSSFWTSPEWEKCLSDGTFLSLDYLFWVNQLLRIWDGREGANSRADLYDAVLSYLRETPFQQLVTSHAAYLDDRQLENFVDRLCSASPAATAAVSSEDPLLLEKSVIVSKNWTTLDDIAFYHALTAEYRPRVVSLLLAEPNSPFIVAFQKLIASHFPPLETPDAEIARDRDEYWAMRRRTFFTEGFPSFSGFLTRAQCKAILLEAVILHLRLSISKLDRASADALMTRERIPFEILEEESRKKRKKHKKEKEKWKQPTSPSADRDDTTATAPTEGSAPEKVFMGWRSPSKVPFLKPEMKKRKRDELLEDGEELPEEASSVAPISISTQVPMITLGLRDLPNFLAGRFYDDMMEWIRARV